MYFNDLQNIKIVFYTSEFILHSVLQRRQTNKYTGL